MVVRDAFSVQFGVDAASAGVLLLRQGEDAAGVCRVLRAARQPVGLTALADGLCGCGVPRHRARVMIADLLCAGVLVDWFADPGEVVVLGDGPAVAALVEALGEVCGVVARRVGRGQADAQAIAGAAGVCPVVLVNYWRPTSAVCRALVEHSARVVPVSFVGEVVEVGPLHVDGRGPCVVCAELRRRERDPLWASVAKELVLSPGGAGGVGWEKGWLGRASLVAALLLRPLLVAGVNPPAGGAVGWVPGAVVRAGLGSWEVSASTLPSHPLCPDCFERRSRAAAAGKRVAGRRPDGAGV
ncbi:hypothetical protein CAQU_03045 [Corynebacterium aquilae DSM 44791]|uniref:Bacteriocin biosynthesis cyclodehydratase domain-containing protein n=1 Tax=Corynebacterium aquilae DSM 44791 TaxID=1431546 RepID=A0A1L7CEE4_9CORY|nr:hypothetical protein CAQU_03045 [Corynebacterium aquilae DSM 44791]